MLGTWARLTKVVYFAEGVRLTVGVVQAMKFMDETYRAKHLQPLLRGLFQLEIYPSQQRMHATLAAYCGKQEWVEVVQLLGHSQAVQLRKWVSASPWRAQYCVSLLCYLRVCHGQVIVVLV